MPEDVEMVNVDPLSGLRYDADCNAGALLPFIRGSAPGEVSPCGTQPADSAKTGDNAALKPAPVNPGEEKKDADRKNWFQRLFN
jgi:hypothetical protein